MRIKLIHPPGLLGFPGGRLMPYGMGVLAAYIRQAGYDLDLADLYVESKLHNESQGLFSRDVINVSYLAFPGKLQACFTQGIHDPELRLLGEQLLALTEWRGYDVVGFSIHSETEFLFALLLSALIKEGTNAHIVFGGSFVTLYAALFFERYSFIDYMIVGDGGVPVLQLFDYLGGNGDLAKIPGLWFRNGDHVVHNERMFFPIEDMPLPDFSGLPIDAYRFDSMGGEAVLYLPYQISRGCNEACSFCTHDKVDIRPEAKSPEKVVRELREYTEKYKAYTLDMCDSTFNVFYQECQDVCDAIASSDLAIKWVAFVKLANLDVPLLTSMRNAGCRLMKLGIETGSDSFLKKINKRISLPDVSSLLKAANELGINNRTYFMVGYPYEEQSDREATVDFIKKHADYIQSISVYIFRLNRGAIMAENPEQYGITLRESDTKLLMQYDEMHGHKHEEKMRSNIKAMTYVLRAIYPDLLARKLCIKRLPFLFYCTMEKMKLSGFFWRIVRRLPKRLLDALYQLDARYSTLLCSINYGVFIAKELFPFQKVSKNNSFFDQQDRKVSESNV